MNDIGSMEEAHRTQQVVHDDFDVIFGQGLYSFDEHTPQVLSDALEDDHDPSDRLVIFGFRDDKVKDFGRVDVLIRVGELAQDLHLRKDSFEASRVPLNV